MKLIDLKSLQLKMKVKMLVYKIVFEVMHHANPLLPLYMIIATITRKQSMEKLYTTLMGSLYKEHQNKQIWNTKTMQKGQFFKPIDENIAL